MSWRLRARARVKKHSSSVGSAARGGGQRALGRTPARACGRTARRRGERGPFLRWSAVVCFASELSSAVSAPPAFLDVSGTCARAEPHNVQPLSASTPRPLQSSHTCSLPILHKIFLAATGVIQSFLEKLEDGTTQEAEGEGGGRDHGTGASLNRAGSGRRRSSRSRSSRRRAGPRRSPRDAARGTRACNAPKRVS